MVTNLNCVSVFRKEVERQANKFIFDLYGFNTYFIVNDFRASSNGLVAVSRFVIYFIVFALKTCHLSAVQHWQYAGGHIRSVCCPNGA